jgi:hypothetical protein
MRNLVLVAMSLIIACDDGDATGPAPDGAIDATLADGTFERDATMDAALAADAKATDMRPVDQSPPDQAPPDMHPDQAVADMRPVIDMVVADMAVADMAVVDMAAPDLAAPDMRILPDQGPPIAPCTPCATDRDCADDALCSDLIDGRRCVRMCSAQNPDVCDADYNCVNDLCLPAGARCDSCSVQGCPADQRCEPFSGNCVPRAGQCEACTGGEDCAPGLNCIQLGMVNNCLPACDANGMCPDGLICIGGNCAPPGGVCDACGGCPLDRPLCNGFTGECLQCGLGVPCLPGFSCDLAGECQANPAPGVCNTDLDCGDDVGQPRCVEGMCAECLDGADCPAGTQCAMGVCAPADACSGIVCQPDTACDPADGTCRTAEGALGCAADADCGDMRACNLATGQCYRVDQRCDDQSVCAPGSECRPDPFDMNQTICTCVKTNVADPAEANDAHRVPCQPGGVCLQLNAAPGACVPAP